MAWLRVLAGGLLTLAALAVAVGLLIGFAWAVLWAAGRILPLAGRGRRKD
jgi:hypothetical protein